MSLGAHEILHSKAVLRSCVIPAIGSDLSDHEHQLLLLHLTSFGDNSKRTHDSLVLVKQRDDR